MVGLIHSFKHVFSLKFMEEASNIVTYTLHIINQVIYIVPDTLHNNHCKTFGIKYREESNIHYIFFI